MKALVGAFSVIVKTGCGTDGALHSTRPVEPPQLPLGLGLAEGAARVQLVREAAVEARAAADVVHIPE